MLISSDTTILIPEMYRKGINKYEEITWRVLDEKHLLTQVPHS